MLSVCMSMCVCAVCVSTRISALSVCLCVSLCVTVLSVFASVYACVCGCVCACFSVCELGLSMDRGPHNTQGPHQPRHRLADEQVETVGSETERGGFNSRLCARPDV